MSGSNKAQKRFKILYFILVFLSSVHRTQATRFARSEGRIVDGVNVTPVNKYPMIVALIERGVFVCAGTILNKYYVLTVSDCAALFNPDAPNEFHVVAGVYGLGNPDPRYAQNISVRSVTSHLRVGDPTKGTFSNNIAVIRLGHPLVWNDYVAPTNLPMPGWNFFPTDEIKAIAVGWGQGRDQAYPHGPSRPLQEITLPLLSTEDCQRKQQEFSLTDDQFCMEAVGGAGPCYEDQGGPAFIYDDTKDKHMQIGMFSISWEICGNVTDLTPSRWTKVSMFIHWIDEVIRECNLPRTF